VEISSQSPKGKVHKLIRILKGIWQGKNSNLDENE